MKKKLKKILIGPIAAAAVNLPSQAQVSEVYPVTNPQCNLVITQPAGSSGYYLNRDCTVAFVLPPKNGTIKVERASQLSNLQLCPSLTTAYGQHSRYQELQIKTLEKLAKDNLTPVQREEVRKDAELINKTLQDLFKPFQGVPGAVVQVSYTMPEADDWVGEFLKKNPNMGADYRLKFQTAPIAESVLSIKGTNKSGVVTALDPVISAIVPGLRPINGDANRLVGDATIMNGHVSGQLTLGLTGACDYQKGGQNNLQDLVVHMVGNVTYAVPVMASVGYNASIKSDTAMRNLHQSWQQRSITNKSETGSVISQGTAGDAFTFTVTAHELRGTTPEDELNFFGKIREEVRERLVNRLVKQLEMAGILEMSMPVPPANAADPGYLEQVRIRRECSSNNGFLGIGASSRCADIPYVVKIEYGTTADKLIEKLNQTSFNNTENVLIRSPIYRTHTGTFMPIAE